MVAPSAYAPNLPISMEKIILKCTQKNADRRYESMTALLTDLRKALVSPNEDFVVMVPTENQDKTRIIADDELKQIKKETGSIHVNMPEVTEPEETEDDELEDDDTEELNPKMEKAITIMGIVAAVIIVIIIIVLLVNLFGGFGSGKSNKSTEKESSQTTETSTTETSDTEKLTVPDVRGKTYEAAKSELEAMGLTIENKGEISSNDYDEGQVANQDPVAGESLAEGGTVEVVISSGKGSIDVPGVTGVVYTDAISTLENEGFKVEKTYS